MTAATTFLLQITRRARDTTPTSARNPNPRPAAPPPGRQTGSSRGRSGPGWVDGGETAAGGGEGGGGEGGGGEGSGQGGAGAPRLLRLLEEGPCFLRRPWFLTKRSAREVGKPVWTGTRVGDRREASRRPREGRFSGLGIAGGEHTGGQEAAELPECEVGWSLLVWLYGEGAPPSLFPLALDFVSEENKETAGRANI